MLNGINLNNELIEFSIFISGKIDLFKPKDIFLSGKFFLSLLSVFSSVFLSVLSFVSVFLSISFFCSSLGCFGSVSVLYLSSFSPSFEFFYYNNN